ncbi:MAG: NeuD/PglB/VioB family sugar acetyltransferase [Gemmatimonadota bacterium]|nr:NeuD/PglB/VioB family sugar acetyltransferase [Gemmatimonadota bacterium]
MDIIVVGASGQAKVIVDIVEREGAHRVVGVVSHDGVAGGTFLGYPVLGRDVDLVPLVSGGKADGALLAIGDNWVRGRLAESLRRSLPGLPFPTAIHPTAAIGRDVTIGEGTVIMAGAVINGPTRIGRHCAILARSSVDHDSILGDFSSLAPGVSQGGGVTVGEYAAIGVGASVRHGIRIGAHTVVGAGAAVVADLPDLVVAYGVPARVARSREQGERYL